MGCCPASGSRHVGSCTHGRRSHRRRCQWKQQAWASAAAAPRPPRPVHLRWLASRWSGCWAAALGLSRPRAERGKGSRSPCCAPQRRRRRRQRCPWATCSRAWRAAAPQPPQQHRRSHPVDKMERGIGLRAAASRPAPSQMSRTPCGALAPLLRIPGWLTAGGEVPRREISISTRSWSSASPLPGPPAGPT